VTGGRKGVPPSTMIAMKFTIELDIGLSVLLQVRCHS
jgi:hypothetical protein